MYKLNKAMNKFIKKTTLLSAIFILLACNARVNAPDDDPGPVVKPVGQHEYLEIATWNIENYPKGGAGTITAVKELIRDLDIDLFGVQEIADVSAFNSLMDSLPGYRAVLSNDVYSSGSYQKTGIIYKSEFISIANVRNIFEDDGYAFPRPPLTAFVTVRDLDSVKYDFTLIVLHLKALGGDSNEARRREACQKLELFIDEEIRAGADADFVVVGDWNDQLDDPETDNVFMPFLSKSDEYRFLTNGLDQESYISNSFNSLIDHIMISQSSFDEFGIGSAEVQYLDNQINGYASTVSDHRPVVAVFRGGNMRLRLTP